MEILHIIVKKTMIEPLKCFHFNDKGMLENAWGDDI